MKKLISFFLSVVMLVSVVASVDLTAKASSENSISIGDYLTLGTYLGEPITWRCVDIDKNGPLMLSDKILCLKSFDAAGTSDIYHKDGWGYVRKRSGSNCWYDSSIRQWLNTSGSVEYTHCPPNSTNVYNGYNPYDDEDGFLTSFTNSELSLIKTVSQKVYLNSYETQRQGYCDGGSSKLIYSPSKSIVNYDNYYYQIVTDKMFLLGPTQANAVYRNFDDYFINAYPTNSAVNNSNYISNYLSPDKPFDYWLNIPRNEGASYENVTVITERGLSNSGANYGTIGIRPAFYLNVEQYQKYCIKNLLNDIDLSADLAKITIDVAGKKVPLISFKANFKMSFANLEITEDSTDDSIKVVLGFDKKTSADMDGSINSSNYWSESYKQVKSMYTEMTGKVVDNTRLWNKYSKLRGRLRKDNCSLFVSAKAEIAGFLEFRKTSYGYQFREGGIITSINVGGDFRNYYGPSFISIGMYVGLDGKISLKRETNGTLTPAAAFSPSFRLKIGCGVGGRNSYIEGSTSGTLKASFDTTNPSNWLQKVSFSASLNLRGVLANHQIFSKTYDFLDTQLYPKTVKQFAALNLYCENSENNNSYEVFLNSAPLVNRENYRDNSSSVYSRKMLLQKNLDNFYIDSLYPANQPQLVSFNNGNMLLIWIDDVEEKSGNNMCSLKYSYYDGTNWSIPDRIAEDGCNNDSPYVYCDGTTAYIVWLRANRQFDDEDLSDMIKDYDINYISYDSTNNEFSTVIRIENDNYFEVMPTVSVKNGTTYIYWMQNLENNIFMDSSSNEMCLAVIKDGTVSKTVVDNTESTYIDVLAVNDNVFFLVQENEVVNLYTINKISNSLELIAEDVIQIRECSGDIFYLANGNLCKYCPETEEIITSNDENYLCCNNFDIGYYNGEYYLVSSSLNYEDCSDFYLNVLDENDLSVKSTDYFGSVDGFANKYSLAICSSGAPKIAVSYIKYAKNEYDYDITSLKVLSQSSDVDVSVNYVDFDDTMIDETCMDFDLNINNNSSNNISSFLVTIYDNDDNVINEINIDENVVAFSSQTIVLNNIDREKYDYLKFKVVPLNLNDYDMSNNTVETSIECGHVFDEQIIDNTCTEDGTVTRTCIYCGYTQTDVILATGHSWSEWTYNGDAVYVSATEYTDGTATRTCTECGESETKTIEGTGLLRARTATCEFASEVRAMIGVKTEQTKLFSNVYCKFTREDGKEIIVNSDKSTLSQDETTAYYPFAITPQSLHSDIKVQFYAVTNDGITVWGQEYTYNMMNNYIKKQIANTTNESWRKLLVELVYYGYENQIKSGWKLDQLLIDELTDEQKALHSTEELTLNKYLNTSYVVCENPLTTWRSVNLEFGASTNPIFRTRALALTDDIKAVVTIEGDEKVYTYNYSDPDDAKYFKVDADVASDTTGIYFTFGELPAKRLRSKIYVTLYKGDTPITNTLEYSAETYCNSQSSKDPNMTDQNTRITQQLMRYGNAARAYFGI